jgi:hypothetical protein
MTDEPEAPEKPRVEKRRVYARPPAHLLAKPSLS